MPTQKNSAIETLRNVMIELHGIRNLLDGVVHPKITTRLEKILDAVETELKPTLEAEKKDWETEYNALDEISKEHKFTTTWSMSKVTSKDMEKKTPEIKKITYESWGETQVHEFDEPTELTWLEFWKLADSMILKSGDSHHIFIESLYEESKGTGHYRLYTGS